MKKAYFRTKFDIPCFLVHLSRRLRCTIVIIRCPSSVVRPSVRRPSVRPSLTFKFSTSPLKPLNRIQRNLSASKNSMSSTKFVFFRLIGKPRWPPGLWLAETLLTSPLKPLNRMGRKSTGSKILRSFIKFVFFGPIGKTRWPPLPLICWDVFGFSSETAERNLMKLNRKQDLNVL